MNKFIEWLDSPAGCRFLFWGGLVTGLILLLFVILLFGEPTYSAARFIFDAVLIVWNLSLAYSLRKFA